MDQNLIYIKTASGENAIAQRTRIIQRNVRMVLILVDGQSSVADLTRKIGNLQLTENALEELEKGGFIELKQQEVRSAATRGGKRPSPGQGAQENPPNPRQTVSAPGRLDGPANRPMGAPSSLFPFDTRDEPEFAASRFSLPPGSLKPQTPRAAKPSLAARLNSSLNSILPGAGQADEPIKIKPIRRKKRKWLAGTFCGLAGVLVLGGAAALLFPLNFLVPDLEAALATATNRPVRIGEVRAQAYPEPGLVLGDVQIGQGDGVIRGDELKLQPDLGTFFSERRSLRRVILSGLNLSLERVAEIPVIFSALADPNRSPKIGNILLRNTDISFSGLILRDAEAEIQRDAQGGMQALSVRSADKSLDLIARPVAGAIDLAVEGFAWRPDENSRFVVDSLSFKGRLSQDTLAISGLEMRIFDGLVQGDAVVRAGGAPNLTGTVSFERIDSSRLGDALEIGRKLTGAIAGEIRCTANSEAWATIFSSLDGDGEFTVQRGSLYGIDLAEAARRGTRVQGGLTTFEQMSGRVRLTPDRVQFRDLIIASGLMRTTGQFDIAKTGALNGRLELQMMGSVNQTRMPVAVSGTLDAPTAQALGRQ
jgi:hypothetical protein